MFAFFDAIAAFISSIVSFVVNLIASVVLMLEFIVQGVTNLFAVVSFLPAFLFSAILLIICWIVFRIFVSWGS